MRIGILLPSEEQKAQAGVRIRYSRIEPALKQLGHKLDLITIQDLTGGAACVNDVYIISKCYDARAHIIARYLAQAGKAVGVDLFDDYFSQHADSRFVRLRYWLRGLIPHCKFILCSTPGMRELAQVCAPGLPVHVMNDPAAEINADAIAAATSRKLETARNQRRIDVAWFGIGDNPNFPVGLSDLAAFGSEVDRLRGYGYDVNLEILTNRRAMTSEYLAAISRLATSYTLEEWNETRESELLARSLLSFLPVNAQNFSRVKSLNRAVTALTAGVQVLSAGYPLYAPLAPFIYRNPRQFLRDLQNGKPALRPDTVQSLAASLKSLADISHETTFLAEFLVDACSSSTAVSKSGPSAVIHGKETTGNIHKFAQQNRTLSVASPLCQASLNYDIRFEFSPDGQGYDVYIASKKVDQINASFKPKLISHGSILTTQYKKLQTETVFPHMRIQGRALAALNSPGGMTAAYPLIMNSIVEVMEQLFPGVTCFHAEQSKLLPWHVGNTATVMESEVGQ